MRAADRAVVVLNVGHDDEETAGMGRCEDVRALQGAAPGFAPSEVIVDVAHADEAGLASAIADWGSRLRVAPVHAAGTPSAHDPAALRTVLAAVASDRGLTVPAAG